jgi:hypothetical protein
MGHGAKGAVRYVHLVPIRSKRARLYFDKVICKTRYAMK